MAADATDRGEQKHPKGDSSSKTSWAQVGDYAQLAFLFPAATLVGWLIGVMLDKWMHTKWLYIVGLLFGIIAGFVELIRTVAKNNRRPPKV